MKDKIILQAIEKEVEASLVTFSLFSRMRFSVHTNEQLNLSEDLTKNVPGLGIILEVEKDTPEGPMQKKLYDRRYSIGSNSLALVKLTAYRELLDLMVGTFLMTAERADTDTLKKVSRPNTEVNPPNASQ